MKPWHLQRLLCCLLGLGACGEHREIERADAAILDAAALDGDNGGQVRVSDGTRARSSAATGTNMAGADAAVSSNSAGASGGPGASEEAGRRSFPGFPRAAGSGADGRPGGGVSGRPSFPGFGGSGSFPRRPRDRDRSDEDAGAMIDAATETPAADSGVKVDAGTDSAAGEGGAGSPAEEPPDDSDAGEPTP